MEIEVKVPNGKSGDWTVGEIEVKSNDFGQMIRMAQTGRGVPGGIYKRLIRKGTTVMSNTPDEIRDFSYFLYKAKGGILIHGLGIGVLVVALLEKEDITDITIIEKSKDVLNLSAATYENHPKVTIIHADCFEWESPKNKRYGAVWHDIWDNITSDNLEEMKKLHRKYGRKADYQESWCRHICERERREEKEEERWHSMMYPQINPFDEKDLKLV